MTEPFGPLPPCDGASSSAPPPAAAQDGSSSPSVGILVGAVVGGITALCCKWAACLAWMFRAALACRCLGTSAGCTAQATKETTCATLSQLPCTCLGTCQHRFHTYYAIQSRCPPTPLTVVAGLAWWWYVRKRRAQAAKAKGVDIENKGDSHGASACVCCGYYLDAGHPHGARVTYSPDIVQAKARCGQLGPVCALHPHAEVDDTSTSSQGRDAGAEGRNARCGARQHAIVPSAAQRCGGSSHNLQVAANTLSTPGKEPYPPTLSENPYPRPALPCCSLSNTEPSLADPTPSASDASKLSIAAPLSATNTSSEGTTLSKAEMVDSQKGSSSSSGRGSRQLGVNVNAYLVDYKDLKLEKLIGRGSFGRVRRGGGWRAAGGRQRMCGGECAVGRACWVQAQGRRRARSRRAPWEGQGLHAPYPSIQVCQDSSQPTYRNHCLGAGLPCPVEPDAGGCQGAAGGGQGGERPGGCCRPGCGSIKPRLPGAEAGRAGEVELREGCSGPGREGGRQRALEGGRWPAHGSLGGREGGHRDTEDPLHAEQGKCGSLLPGHAATALEPTCVTNAYLALSH